LQYRHKKEKTNEWKNYREKRKYGKWKKSLKVKVSNRNFIESTQKIREKWEEKRKKNIPDVIQAMTTANSYHPKTFF
jgi:hypothetical protein